MKATLSVSWIRTAREDFEALPPAVQIEGLHALTVAAEGGKSDNVKPLQGFTGGVFEIVCGIAVMRSASSMPCRSVRISGCSTPFRKNPPKGSRRRSAKLTLCRIG
jgi:hypothetical protein